ncbi:MAG: hypothetical protein OXS47_03065 [Chloroflexota bacterium]|nr:hypothetical protein [Chloroflexota bacterium]
MAGVLVILPAGVAPPPLPEGVEVRTCANSGEVAAALRQTGGDVVLCVDGLPDAEVIAGAVRTVGAAVILVEQDAWDGEAHSPVSAACAGVVAGFGIAGVAAAVALLLDG